MLGYSLLSILLHLGIDGCVNPQTVCIEVVFRAICLEILVQPAVQRVCRPLQGVHNIIFLEIVTGPLRLLGVHRTQKHVLEVESKTGMMVLSCVRKDYR